MKELIQLVKAIIHSLMKRDALAGNKATRSVSQGPERGEQLEAKTEHKVQEQDEQAEQAVSKPVGSLGDEHQGSATEGSNLGASAETQAEQSDENQLGEEALKEEEGSETQIDEAVVEEEESESTIGGNEARIAGDMKTLYAETEQPKELPPQFSHDKRERQERDHTVNGQEQPDDQGRIDLPQQTQVEQEPSSSNKRGSQEERRETEEDRDSRLPILDLSSDYEDYVQWNTSLVEQLLLSNSADSRVYLCVTPRILASAYEEAGFETYTPLEAELNFEAAVSEIYKNLICTSHEGLRIFERISPESFPNCVAFLAASVLAAYNMHSDEEATGGAYYRRLAQVLGCEMSGIHPVGFDPRLFESLWKALKAWLKEARGVQLAMPGENVGLRRYIALPLAHVPLRRLDIEKLPAFFVSVGYQPGDRVPAEKLTVDLRNWQQSANALSRAGTAALNDDRLEAVIAQVNAELEVWDGSVSESSTRRSALVEIKFDIVHREPKFDYMPHRPSGFPETFESGDIVFEASDEGWYDPQPVKSSDGPMLAAGFEWQMARNGTQFTLRRPKTLAIALAPSSGYSGFMSTRRLYLGIKASVLCHEDIVKEVEDYISQAACQRVNAVRDRRLPHGWSMIRDVLLVKQIQPPAGLEALEIDPNIEIMFSGGLKLGRRFSWLAGAPPRVIVTGSGEGEKIKINGESFEIGKNGEILTDEIFASPGEYIIEAGRTLRRIEIENPRVPSAVEKHAPAWKRKKVMVALPEGSWTVIGAVPGQMCTSMKTFGAALASCQFHPVWAIKVGGGPGAVVAILSDGIMPKRPRAKKKYQVVYRQWADAIYAAHIRRPTIIGINGIHPTETTASVWNKYVALSKQIKRSLKRR